MKDHKWSATGPVIFGVVGLLLLVGLFGTWAALSSIAGAVVAPGRIEVDRNRQIVQHPDGGIVSRIYIDEGDVVQKGQTLIQLDSKLLDSDLRITEGQLFELMARSGRLAAERDDSTEIAFDPMLIEEAKTSSEAADFIAGQRRLFEARHDSITKEADQLERRKSQIRSQIEGVEAQQASLGKQLDLISQELDNQQNLLDRGLAQATTVLNLRRTAANLEGRLGELKATKAQAEGRITEIDIGILKLRTKQREDAITQLRDLKYRELELAEKRKSLQQRLDRLDIKAPVSGVVYGLQVKTLNSVIRPAEPLMYIVPQNRPLVIVAQVDPLHIDEISVGQPVTVSLPAFNRRTTPSLNGHISKLSADAFDDQKRGRSFYRAEILLDEGEQDRLPKGTTLVPGMPVQSFIRTRDRSPLNYLLKPFMDYFDKAFRET